MLATLLRRLLRRSSICAACLSLEIETMQKETIHPHKSYMMNSSYALPTPSRPLHPHLFPSHLPLNRAPRPAPSKGVLLATEGAEARHRPVVFPLDDLRRLPKVSSFLSRTAAGRAASERIARKARGRRGLVRHRDGAAHGVHAVRARRHDSVMIAVVTVASIDRLRQARRARAFRRERRPRSSSSGGGPRGSSSSDGPAQRRGGGGSSSSSRSAAAAAAPEHHPVRSMYCILSDRYSILRPRADRPRRVLLRTGGLLRHQRLGVGADRAGEDDEERRVRLRQAATEHGHIVIEAKQGAVSASNARRRRSTSSANRAQAAHVVHRRAPP